MRASALTPLTCCRDAPSSHPALLPAAAHAESHASFGFSLTFAPRKRPVRNGVDGVSPGAEAADAMFYYSITRMAVAGTVTPPCTAPSPPSAPASASTEAVTGDRSNGPSGATAKRLAGPVAGVDASSCTMSSGAAPPAPVQVSGDGWYDHEFGGNAEQAKGGAGHTVPTAPADVHSDETAPTEPASGGAPGAASGSGAGGGLGMPDVQWVWTGVQLSDGTELTYARSADASTNGTIVDKAVLVPASGGAYNAEASLEQLGEWTSLRTFIRYGTRWRVKVPSEGLHLELRAVADNQELISIVATPAYWEGQVRRTGARPGKDRGADLLAPLPSLHVSRCVCQHAVPL